MTTALVIGAAGGVGRAVVARLIADGTAVIAVDRDPAVRQLVGVAAAFEGDATDDALLAAAFDAASEPASILVHAVLSEHRAPLEELEPRHWHRVFDEGLVSAWQAAAALVRRKPAGVPASIVLTGSVHAHGAAPGFAPYAVAKAGLGALARAAATEWGHLGVRTNVVEPGFVAVPRNAHRWRDPGEREHVQAAYPSDRLCSPEEVAEVVAFLAGPASSYVNGVCLPVDGGALAVLPEVHLGRREDR
ncbi:SDR family NAD(P)-dependent oxidoreductase [Streptomyces xanthochromogenes]|uniref:SDR family NAD(P)-dependent oxidoreductase n=1 Tax=Streptomyces xanthochromogenes TaxID=67384 RepID=UPI00380FDFAD